MKATVSYLVFVLFICTALKAQSISKPNIIVAGPYGVPQFVRDEGENWSTPILVYSDKSINVYIPDITTPGWAQWHAKEFTTNGRYETYVYIYDRRSRLTQQELINVDDKSQTVIIELFMLPPIQKKLSDTPIAFANAIQHTTSIVKDSAQRFHGQPIESSIRQQQFAVARMARCSGPGEFDADCDLSDEDFKKLHPSYRDSPQHSAKGASVPVLVYSVEPQYPDEARSKKQSGTVQVHLWVSTQGLPTNVTVASPLGSGLDEAAINAVNQYRFNPARDSNGVTIPFELYVNINFHIH